MDPAWDDLAARLRAAASDQRPAPTPRPPPAPDEARDALRGELRAFGAALGVVDVHDEGDDLVWATALRRVRFTPARHGFDVTWTEPRPHRGRAQEPVLDHRWVLDVHGVPHGDRLPLFPQGLLRLVVQGLDLPAPGAEPPATVDAPAAASSEPQDDPPPQRRTL